LLTDDGRISGVRGCGPPRVGLLRARALDPGPGRLVPYEAAQSADDCTRRDREFGTSRVPSPGGAGSYGLRCVAGRALQRRAEPAPTDCIAAPNVPAPGGAFRRRTEPAPTGCVASRTEHRTPESGMTGRTVRGPGDRGRTGAPRGRCATFASPAAENSCAGDLHLPISCCIVGNQVSLRGC
jgi:hypothetical protein